VLADAAALANLARRARRALAYGRSPVRHFDEASKLAARYRSEVVRHADPIGVAMGIRFIGSRFVGPRGNVFFIA